MRKKIFIYCFVACTIAVLITSVIAFVVMRSSVIEETERSAQSMANMITNMLGDEQSTYDETAKSLKQETVSKEQTSYRVTVISMDGTVLGDSNADIAGMDDHSERPEVVQAQRSGVGSARRKSDTLGINMLYVAVKDDALGVYVRVALPLTELQRMSVNLFVGSLIGLLVGQVVSLIAAFLFSGKLSKPIKKLAAAASKLAQDGKASEVKLSTGTELDELAHDFNDMSGRLNTSMNTLRHKNAEFDAVLGSMEDALVVVDKDSKVLYINHVASKLFGASDDFAQGGRALSELCFRKPVLNAAVRCMQENDKQVLKQRIGVDGAMDFSVYIYPMYFKDALSGAILLFRDVTHVLKLEKLRSDFVANVSHEMKTPLTSIIGYAQALKEDESANDTNTMKFLDIIELEAERLNLLINDLMELSMIEHRSEDTDISEYELKGIVEETVALVQLSASKKDVEVSVDMRRDFTILANRNRIKQLLLNLLDNGIKYNKQGGSLTLSAREHNGMLRLSVKDTGEGIDSKSISRLFERFYREDKSRSKELGGTGLGLSIVKHIAELYGGSVTVSSEKGVGSEFVVTLPVLK
ncbi:MAG: HAMP domain-containing protein [Clostridia bacterium]|jgi:two-component system, OmpR family, phosphate regulon sensor histidine kinase PhoR|nr:HAMP domain-containing protein [Clostridia bacterium]